MATKIKVGGELASVAVDEKLVDAIQVKDESRANKSQKEINDELANSVDGKIAKTDIAAATGASAQKVMSQKAVTDALGGKLDKTAVKAVTGTSATDTMSQKAITEALAKKQGTLKAGTGISIATDGTIKTTLDVGLYKVVSALPTTDIDTNKIYLVPDAGGQGQNVYVEYMYVDSKWEIVGQYKSDVDLTPYFKKENIQKHTDTLNSTADDKVPSSALLYKELAAKAEFAGLVKGHYAKPSAIPSNATDGSYLIDANASGTSGSYIVTVASGSVVAPSEHLATSGYLYMTLDGHVYEAKNGAAWYDQGAIKTSTNDYTTAEKNKLAGIQAGANKTVVDPALSPTSTNPVQNKTVNAKFVELQNEIAVINADKATFSLSRTSGNSLYFVGDTFTIKATATCSVFANTITIKCGNSTIASVQNAKTATGSQTIDPTFSSAPTTINFTAEAVIGSVKKTASFSVGLVNPMYVGAGAVYTNVVNDSHKQSVRTSASGTYNVTVASNGQHVFFVVPSSMTINKVTLSGFDFPLDAADTTSKSGYKIYKSSNTYKAGAISLVVS